MPNFAPPSNLTKPQRALFNKVVESKPSSWFTDDNIPILEEYCRCMVTCRQLNKQVDDAVRSKDLPVMKELLKLRDRESKRGTTLATKLRLTQQSKYTKGSAATAANKGGVGGAPWEA